MPARTKSPSSWLYPDRDAWDRLLDTRPKPRPVMEKPPWWRGRWPARWPGKPTAAALSNERMLESVRKELAWAQKCFYYAQSALPDSQARRKAARLAEAIGRARRAIDVPEKAEDIEHAVDELAGVARYDPAKSPSAFVETAGRSVAAAGQIMETSRFESVAYWGRVFARAGGFFRAMKSDLPHEGARALPAAASRD